MKICRQTVRRIMALLAFAAIGLLCLTGLSPSVCGLLACCLVLVTDFLVTPVAAPRLFGWQSEISPPPQEPCLPLLIARPPPFFFA